MKMLIAVFTALSILAFVAVASAQCFVNPELVLTVIQK